MGHDIVQDSIWEQDGDSKEDQEDDSDDGDTFDMWDITVETDEILNVTMVDDEADFNPTKDLEELERLLAKEPQSNFMKIQMHLVIINTEPFIHTQLLSPLYGVFNASKPCKVDKDIISPERGITTRRQISRSPRLVLCGNVATVAAIMTHTDLEHGLEHVVSSYHRANPGK
ncbi:hypothetical protein Tco_0003882 [Tanacetum coccineum]